ncbi:D-xylose-proton symporter-like 2 isoform X2 [Rhododendron vialii]|uniref:D-xylose-proton symporter-like 2 isoform X2 n=1 Tax=Rhododendron vialii TaxID=182163 RepID=UPI00265E8187|nr:D-xylose-proton symporter-like 2 isoform X2 [Rhododendron vialii]
MASRSSNQHQPALSSLGKTSGEINGERQPLLINGEQHFESFSVLAAVLPFLFPALGGFLYGYDIGSTSCATISVESATLSGITWYNLSSVEIGLIAMHAAPMYISETAPSQIRGRLISLKEFFIVLGMVAGYTFGSLLVDTVSGWRYMYGASTPVAVIMGIGMWWLPSSPRWLLLCAIQGKGSVQDLRETAISCLCRLQGKAVGNSSSEQVDEILAELSYMGDEKEAKIADMFHGKCLKALTISAGLVLFQQITGQPSVLYYAASILQSAGFSAASDATRVSILLGLLKLIMTGVAVLVIDRLGRRPLLLGGVSAMVISLFLLGSYYTFLDDAPVMAVVALLLYVGCYQLSFGPIGWLMISEIFPLRMRGRGLSIAVLVNFGANAIVTFAFSPLKELLGAGILFFIFGGIAVSSIFFIYFIVPETKGLTLEEIEAKLL